MINTLFTIATLFPLNGTRLYCGMNLAVINLKKAVIQIILEKPDRKPTFFVNHWDVCLSADSCAKVLNKRGISVHFLIDNDGTIFQMLDTQHKAWHAGHSSI